MMHSEAGEGYNFENVRTSCAVKEESWGNKTREGVRRGGNDDSESSEGSREGYEDPCK